MPKSLISDQVLHADILFMDKMPILISVSKPLRLTIASHREGCRLTAQGFDSQDSQVYRIKTLVFDGEGAIGVIADDIAALGTNIDLEPMLEKVFAPLSMGCLHASGLLLCVTH